MVRRSVVAVGVVLLLFAVVTQFGLWLWVVSPGEYDRATVEVVDGNDTRLATVDARLAETSTQLTIGLSETDSLAPDEGMLFVHEEADEHAYVMRRMAFPLDIVFVAPNGTVTGIEHADPAGALTPELLLRQYRGYGKYVLEVERGWANRTGVEPGDRVRVPGLVGPSTDADAAGPTPTAQPTPTGVPVSPTPTAGSTAAPSTATTTPTPATTPTPTPNASLPRVTAVDRDGTALGTVGVRIRDDRSERYTGLSDTESLPWNEGMLFVYDEPRAELGYVMRRMSFPIDIVYVAANGTVVRIHHASTPPESGYERVYEGRGQYVLEVNRGWTNATGLGAGDRLELPPGV